MTRHPSADLAVLITDTISNDSLPGDVYSGISDQLVEGGDFLAYGYPAEGPESTATSRYFKGHFQRFMPYTDSAGRSYFAGEMSIPAPAGLSGGPVSYSHSPLQLAGIVTQNIDSFAIVDSIDEIDDDGKRLRVESKRLVTYGVALLLVGEMASWLDSVLPEPVAER